jgi:hypothetical protein
MAERPTPRVHLLSRRSFPSCSPAVHLPVSTGRIEDLMEQLKQDHTGRFG